MKGNGIVGIAVLLYFISLGLIAFGFITMYYYPDELYSFENYFNHVVEGDAYNFIIMAGRGIGFITLGGFIGLIANIVNLYGLMVQKNKVNIVDNNIEA